MIAILTTTLVVDVDDEEEAATMAIGMDKAAGLNMASVMERADVSSEAMSTKIRYLGTAVALVDAELTEHPSP